MRSGDRSEEDTKYNTWNFYVFYFFLQTLVKRKFIPYEGSIPDLKIRHNIMESSVRAFERDFFHLVYGIMRGCGNTVPVHEIVYYPVYRNGHSDFLKLDLMIEDFLKSCLRKLPSEVSVCWSIELKDIVSECVRYGYYGNTGVAVLLWSNSYYSRAMYELKGTYETKGKLRLIYESSKEILTRALTFPEIHTGTGVYLGSVIPLLQENLDGGIVSLQINDYFNPLALYHMVELFYEIQQMGEGKATNGQV